jgi:transcriptional regulator with XRE-family HTH domain
MQATVPLITKNGLDALGKVLKHYRTVHNFSMDKLVAYINEKTGCFISKAAISDLERGNTEPKWDTLAILAASGYLPYTVDQLFAIATERLAVEI